MERGLAGGDAGQEEQFFLDVRGEHRQVQDLGHSRLGDVPQACQFCYVADFAGEQKAFEANSDGHQAGNSRDAAGRDGRRFRFGWGDAAAAVGFTGDLDFAFDGNHAASS